MSNDARAELEALLSETVPDARARAAAAFDVVAGSPDAPIVLFGAGGLGRRVADGLARAGRPAVAFADNDPARAGTTHAGLPVLATADAIARHPDAVFVVAVWRSPASERMSDRIARLEQAGAKRVTSFVTLGWKYPEALLPYYSMDLPHRVLEARDDVLRAFDLLADEPSRREYVAHVRLRLHLDFAGLGTPATETEYFAPDVFRLAPDERFVDCGAYDGDTMRSFLSVVPGGAAFGGRAIAFEPDRTSFDRLATWRASLDEPLRERVEVVRAGVGAGRETLTFQDGGGTGSSFAGGAGSASAAVQIEIVPLDEAALPMRPTLLKVDVEGFEPDVLEGARQLVSTLAPTMALCVYHRQDHPWRIPLLVAAMHPGYRFTLRSYCLDGWDLVLYCVPESRRI
ncbi:MAG: methyltransferase FkbM family [Labilithrix sp.]|nr:methyltransferase FkbM family [Labilithrix sp.]